MDKPNIIFILMDDMGWMDLGCYGSEFYETPNIDRFAREGMQFSDAYAACPVCSPTRASILTGKYPASLGITDWIDYDNNIHPARGKLVDVPYIKYLPFEEESLATALRAGGYSTWHVGKWHLGRKPHYPENHGYDVNIAGCSWGHPYDGYFSPYNIENLEDGPEGEYLTDRITDEAINLIKNRDNKPFFLNLCHYAVHNPIEAKEEDIRYFEDKAERLGLKDIDPFVDGEFFPVDHKKDERVRRRIIQSNPAYAAMIYNLDYNIGRLLDSLEEENLAENTIVIFSSDNGGLATSEGSPTCNFPLSEGKGWMYEGGVREPLIIRWPRLIEADSRCDVPVTSPDFYPTLLEAAGLELKPNQHIDGVSILPLLKGEEKLDRDAIYWHYPHYGNQGGSPGSSIREGDYVLLEFFEDGRLELYNLKEDIGQKDNIASSYPDIVDNMKAKLNRWRESIEAKIPERAR